MSTDDDTARAQLRALLGALTLLLQCFLLCIFCLTRSGHIHHLPVKPLVQHLGSVME